MRPDRGRHVHPQAAAPTDPRLAAARALADVLDHGRSLSAALPKRALEVAPRDRALAAELAYGALRWWPRLDALLARLLERPLKPGNGEVRALLAVGLYQLERLRVPDYAAVSATVDAARRLERKPWAAGLVNAVLRSFQRRRTELEAALAADAAARLAHPRWLLERLRADWPEDWEAIAAAGNAHPPFTLRVNRQRTTRAACLAELAAAGLEAAPHPYAPHAVVLAQACEVERLPGFTEGRVSVQDAAAQLAPPLLELGAGQRVLDACAAPGGKAGHLLETEPSIALLALDLDAVRLARVHENLVRLGLAAEVRAGDAAAPATWWDGRPFDRILVDAPCSATGVLRRHPDVKALRHAADIEALAARQLEVLEALWPLLAPGGILVYATCSILKRENERTLAEFLSRHGDAEERPIAADWGRARLHGRQILPGEADMDGFYYARLGKRG